MTVVDAFTSTVFEMVYYLLDFYKTLLIIGAILSWLLAFHVINNHNRLVQFVGDFIFRVTEPLLRPIRRYVPLMGGVDLSFLVLYFAVWFLQVFVMKLRLVI